MRDTSPATARRNLFQRIDRFVTALEHAQRSPTPQEAQGILNGLGWLELELYPLGEDAMMRVEKGWPPTLREDTARPGCPPPVSAQALRAALEAMDGAETGRRPKGLPIGKERP
jgi:hypothetical protein